MRILIFGATGGTGREVVSQTLQSGYDVSAFVRDPATVAVACHLRVTRNSHQGRQLAGLRAELSKRPVF